MIFWQTVTIETRFSPGRMTISIDLTGLGDSAEPVHDHEKGRRYVAGGSPIDKRSFAFNCNNPTAIGGPPNYVFVGNAIRSLDFLSPTKGVIGVGCDLSIGIGHCPRA